MLLGTGSYTHPWAVELKKHSDQQTAIALTILQYAAEENIHFVQFGDNILLHLFSPAELLAIKQNAKEMGIHVQVGTKGLTIENILKYMDIAAVMNSEFIRIIIDDGTYQPQKEQVIKIINDILSLLKEKNIRLAIENHDRFAAELLEEIILSTDKDHIGICLDTANSFGCGESIRETVSKLAPYTINLHLKDIRIKRLDHKMGFVVEGAIAGEGMLDMVWIIDQLKPYNKCKTAILECWSNPELSDEATLANERRIAKKSIEYLKKIILL